MKSLKLIVSILFKVSIIFIIVSCKDPVPPHEHSFSTEWSKDATYHWHSATCEHTTEVSDKAEHSFGDWTVTKEATEEAEGTKERSCTVCGYKTTEVIAKLDHTHKFSDDWTSDDIYHWHSATCGHTTEVSDKAEHDFTNGQCICGKVLVPEMVFVPGGTIVGATNENNYAGVFVEGRTVTLSDFYMGKYEVTQEEYASVMQGQKVTVSGTEYTLASAPSYCKKGSTRFTLFEGDEQTKRPVEGVTWYDAVWYCNALSSKESLTPAYNIEVTQVKYISGTTDYYIYSANVTLNKNATGYRLPTEAEWEYAARGGDPTAVDWNYTFSGTDTAEGVEFSSDQNAGLDTVGWYWYNTATGTTGDTYPSSGEQGYGTHQVGKKAPNRLGLYDMSGNVREWCYDWYGTVSAGTESDPTGASSGSNRVRRGGGWGCSADHASVSYRFNYDLHGSYDFVLGFRVVRPSSK